MPRRKRVLPPAPTGLPLLPHDLKHRPAAGSTIAVYVLRKRRRDAWFRDAGLLNDRGLADWSKVDRGPSCCPDLVVMGALPLDR